MQGAALLDGTKHNTFRALVEYYVRTYSSGEVANQLCDIMDGLTAQFDTRAAQWTMHAVRNMAEDRRFWDQNCLQSLSDIRSAAISYFERQKVDPTEEVLFDIVQVVVLDFAVTPLAKG
jgi:hypothetical protein